MFKRLIMMLVIPTYCAAEVDNQSGDIIGLSGSETIFDLSLAIEHTDNHLYTSTNEQDSTTYQFSPSINSQKIIKDSTLQFGLWFDIRKFDSFSVDDSTDTTALIKYHYQFNDIHKAIFSAATSNVYLAREAGFSREEQLIDRDRRQASFLNVSYQIGNENSKSLFISTVGTRKTKLSNRFNNTDVFDLSANFLNINFTYQLNQKLILTSNISTEKINYDINVQQDRLITTALIGVELNESQDTIFEVSLGILDFNFDRGNLKDELKFAWNIQGSWSPIEKLTLSAFTLRAADENDQLNNSYLVIDNIGVNINYQFTEALEVNIQRDIVISDFFFESVTEKEKTYLNTITLQYIINAQLSLLFSYINEELEAPNLDDRYDRNIIRLGLDFNF